MRVGELLSRSRFRSSLGSRRGESRFFGGEIVRSERLGDRLNLKKKTI